MKMYEVSYLKQSVGFTTCIIFAESTQDALNKCSKKLECQAALSALEVVVK